MTVDLVVVGDVIDQRFQVVGEIVAGGMGRIYRGEDRHTGKPVAIKVVGAPDPVAVARFSREAVLLAELQHPGVVEYVAHGYLPGGMLYLVMEWLEGYTLSQRLRGRCDNVDADRTLVEKPASRGASKPASSDRRRSKRIRLPVSDVLLLGRRIASTLAAIHRRGIVHRDLKPSNLILVGGHISRVKLIDFGIAREAAVFEPVTYDGHLVGTPHYMSPEQMRGGDIGSPADVWALGCVLYECLTGRAAFSSAQVMAAVTRSDVDDPIPLGVLRPDTPAALEALIHAMLSAKPAARPGSGDALVNSLAAIEADDGDTVPDHTPQTRATGMTVESRVRSLLFARIEAPDTDDLAALRRVAGQHGCETHSFTDVPGAILITQPGVDSPREEAARAARVALALRDGIARLTLVVATGRSRGEVIPAGEVVDRAAATLMLVHTGDVRVDQVTADLLEGRFELRSGSEGIALVGEHSAEGARTLLGRPSRWVGRRRELSMLIATFEDCVEDRRCRAALVTGPAGMGKSRLQHEFLRALDERGEDVEVLRGQGDSLSAGSPFVMIAPAIRRSAGILDGEPLEVRRAKLLERLRQTIDADDLARVAAFLGELIDVPFASADNESLRAARQNPMLLGDLMRDAFITWLAAECARRPVLLVLEDLHWGDLPSVSYVDAALQGLAEQPFMVVALARPEVHTAFPHVWERRAVDEVRLHPLSARACTEIVRDALGAGVADELVKNLVARSEGNAFYLEELVRAAAAGKSAALPDSVIGMVQARLSDLDAGARRMLRAASVFGEVFWEGGVRALVDGTEVFDVGEWLKELTRRELISTHDSSRLPREREYEFRHALVRDAAYDMLADEDRALAHRLAGEWLASAGEGDALVLAGHFLRGGDRRQALAWFRAAAEQALGASDFVAASQRADRAIATGASGAVLGALRAVQSMAASWLSRHDDAVRYGKEAVDLLPEASREWFNAASTTIVSSSRLGDNDTFNRLFARAESAVPMVGAAPAQIVCLCRSVFQLALHGHMRRADDILARVAAIESTVSDLDALTMAQIHDARGGRAFCVGDARAALEFMETAVQAFRRAGDLNNVYLGRASMAWVLSELGDLEAAEALCRDNLGDCERRGVRLGTTVTKMVLGGILARRSDCLAESRERLQAGIEEYRAMGNQTFAGWGYGFLARADLTAGDSAAACENARCAAEMMAASPGLKAWAMALHGRALLGLGRGREALERATAAMAVMRAQGGILGNAALPPLVFAEALDACGDAAGACAAIADARTRVLRHVATLKGTSWRASYLSLPEPARTLALAADWLAS